LKADLKPIDNPQSAAKAPAVTPATVLSITLPVTPTFNVPWKIGTLTPGWYNLRLEAKDAAGNSTYVARNVKIEGASADKVEILFPLSGETVNGSFAIEGKVTSRAKVDTALINLDGKTKVVVDVDSHGYFQTVLDGSLLDKGDHSLVVTVQLTTATTLTSEPKKVTFDPLGPWVRVTSHQSGSYVTQRPFLLGQAGWNSAPLDPGASVDDTNAYRRALEQHQVTLVEVSLDNGKTFGPAQGAESWKYRLESLGLPDGPQPLLFRAHFRDGSIAVQRLLVIVAQTPPTLQLLTPIENGRFNGSLDLAGFTEGDGEVQSVEVAVRQGDKAGYEVPSFIQGAYLDGHFLGATYWEAGLGLTFSNDAVKVQGELGQAPYGRFWGTSVGGKLLAKIASLPASFFLGPDWSWLSSSFSLGANFTQFSMNGNFLDFTSTPGVFLGGVVLQWETAKATLADWTFFKSYSWYNEFTVWFISSDVQAETVWKYATGIRIGLF